jgi:hypothetical protein
MLHKIEKIMQEQEKQKVSSLWEKKFRGVQSLKQKLAARPGSNLFLGMFLYNGEQWNVRNLIPLNSLVLYW